MEPSFIIVIVLYNSAEWIGPCLDSIRAASYRNYQVWVLDNASNDDGAEYVAQSYPWVRLIRSRYNRGFAGGNNEAIAQAPVTDFVMLLNPDTEMHPDCLTRLVEAFARTPPLGVAGCKLLDANGVIQHVGGGIRANGLPYHLGEGEIDHGQYRGRIIPSDYVQGAAMAVRTSLWHQLGGLDQGFNPAYFEEADFCTRAWKAGREVATVCDAVVIHHQDTSKQVQSLTFLKLLFRGRARFLVKHYRLRDWLLRYLPAEIKWLMSPGSKYSRRIAVKSIWNAWTGTPDEFS